MEWQFMPVHADDLLKGHTKKRGLEITPGTQTKAKEQYIKQTMSKKYMYKKLGFFLEKTTGTYKSYGT
jgi:hypothetical protein